MCHGSCCTRATAPSRGRHGTGQPLLQDIISVSIRVLGQGEHIGYAHEETLPIITFGLKAVVNPGDSNQTVTWLALRARDESRKVDHLDET